MVPTGWHFLQNDRSEIGNLDFLASSQILNHFIEKDTYNTEHVIVMDQSLDLAIDVVP
jgi:hypothetical protein